MGVIQQEKGCAGVGVWCRCFWYKVDIQVIMGIAGGRALLDAPKMWKNAAR